MPINMTYDNESLNGDPDFEKHEIAAHPAPCPPPPRGPSGGPRVSYTTNAVPRVTHRTDASTMGMGEMSECPRLIVNLNVVVTLKALDATMCLAEKMGKNNTFWTKIIGKIELLVPQ